MKRKLRCAAIALFATFVGQVIQAAPASTGNVGAIAASSEARYVATWVADSADNQHMPFVIIDKKNVRMFVFEANGHLRGASAVLLGAGSGDVSVPGIARRAPESLRPHERITPAGRFVSEPGHNLNGEDIVWVDYDAKIAIHRLRPDNARAHRAKRLASSAKTDKRVSFGCIVVPVDFYNSVVRPVVGGRLGVIYILPEDGTVQSLLGALN